jgi:hypothetical protein
MLREHSAEEYALVTTGTDVALTGHERLAARGSGL